MLETEVVVVAGLVVWAVVVAPPPPAVLVAPPPGTTVGTVEGCKAVFQVAVCGQAVVAIAGAAIP